jgi:hypothetical protein
MRLAKLGGLIAAATTVAATTAVTVAGGAGIASASTTCRQVQPGTAVQWSYVGTHQDGSSVSGTSLSQVASPGTTIVATAKVLYLDPSSSCLDLTLASYRSQSVTYQSGGYQLLYQSQSATNLHVHDTATLTVVVPQTPGTPGPGCTNTHDLTQNGNGANVPGPYDTTCDGTASGNGNGASGNSNKPCAGCVGNADNKNPQGQLPGPQDHNAGYECDTNQGIAKGNPAHSGCAIGTFWQIDLVAGAPALPYLGVAPGTTTPSLSYGANTGDPKRLYDSWHS